MNDADRLAGAPADRLAALTAPHVASALFDKLVQEPRFRARLLEIATDRLGTVAEADAPARRVLAMTAADLLALTLRVGAVWYAEAIARIIDGESRRRLVELFGAGTMGLALDGRDAAPADAPPKTTPDDLADALPKAGAGAFAVWCRLQPPSVAKRLDLLRPPAEPDALHLTHGPAVVDWVLARP